MVRLPTPLEERFRTDSTWWDFFKIQCIARLFKMPYHLDSPLETDFTGIQIKEFIQRCCARHFRLCAISLSRGLLMKNRGNLWRDCPIKPGPLITMATTASPWDVFHSSDIQGSRLSTGSSIPRSLHIPATRPR